MIYFISDGSLVKIGHAALPYARMDELQVGNPRKLQMLRTVDGGQKVEKWLHKRYAAYRVRGEWFVLNQEMLTVVVPDELPVRRWTLPEAGVVLSENGAQLLKDLQAAKAFMHKAREAMEENCG